MLQPFRTCLVRFISEALVLRSKCFLSTPFGISWAGHLSTAATPARYTIQLSPNTCTWTVPPCHVTCFTSLRIYAYSQHFVKSCQVCLTPLWLATRYLVRVRHVYSRTCYRKASCLKMMILTPEVRMKVKGGALRSVFIHTLNYVTKKQHYELRLQGFWTAKYWTGLGIIHPVIPLHFKKYSCFLPSSIKTRGCIRNKHTVVFDGRKQEYFLKRKGTMRCILPIGTETKHTKM